jgi:hypothetical protein
MAPTFISRLISQPPQADSPQESVIKQLPAETMAINPKEAAESKQARRLGRSRGPQRVCRLGNLLRLSSSAM